MQLKRDSEINCTLNRQYLQVKSENNTEKKLFTVIATLKIFHEMFKRQTIGLDWIFQS